MIGRITASALACAWAVAASAQSAPNLAAPVIKVNGGRVAGVTDDAGVRSYLGIPFAAPPLGKLRFAPPAPVKSWTGVRPGTAFGSDCMMPAKSAQPQSEDCLYLNVWAPAAKSRPRPVMVWIFGSGFRAGSAAVARYGGQGLAQQGVVFVSMNYRLGALGFLSHPALAAESSHHAAGNYGVLDVLAALHWVQRNIAKFGGDPANVTIFGQSSGSETVNILTATPLAHGLFQRAIGESGGSFGEREPKTLAAAEPDSAAFAAKLGATTVAALRALPASAFVQPDVPRFEPVVDGWVLPHDVYDIYAAGHQNDVPMLVGSNADEGQLPSGLTQAAYTARMHDKYGAHAADFLALFPAATDAQAGPAQKSAMTALLGDFNTSTWATLQSRTGHAPVYQYRFEVAPPPLTDPQAGPFGKAKGAFHGAEIIYAFNNLDRDKRAWTAADRDLSHRLSAIWVAFARTGNPNTAAPGTGAAATWPAIRGDQPMVLRIADQLSVVPRPGSGLLARLSAFFYGPGGLLGARAPVGWIPTQGDTRP
jgi:para-nitrobenzyl esterase